MRTERKASLPQVKREKRTGLDGGRNFRTSTYTVGKDFLCPSIQQAVVHGVGNVLGICNGGLRTDCDDTEVGCRNNTVCFWPNVY